MRLDRRQQASDRVCAGLPRANANGLFDIEDENLSVADASRSRSLLNGFDGRGELVVRDDDFDFHLGQEIHDVFGATIEFGMTLLAAETFGFRDRDALDTDFLQRLLHLVELEWFDDGFDFFHVVTPSRTTCVARAALMGLQGSCHGRPGYPQDDSMACVGCSKYSA